MKSRRSDNMPSASAMRSFSSAICRDRHFEIMSCCENKGDGQNYRWGCVGDRHAIPKARAQEKRQVAVGLPENDVERLPKSGLIGRG